MRVYTRIYGNDTGLYMPECPPRGANAHRVLRPAARASGLKITQYILLRAILSGEAAKSITALAEEVGIDRTTTGKNLRLLERDGLVSLGAGNDRRAREVQATEQGRQAVALARPLWQQAQTTMVETLRQGPNSTR